MPVALPDRANSLLSMTLDGNAELLAPTRLKIVEQLTAPYELEVTAIHAGEAELPLGDVLQKKATVTLRRGTEDRVFHGLVRDYTPLATDIRGYRGCILKIVPKVWSLSQANDCRVFQEKTAKEILETLFQEGQITDVAFRLNGEIPTFPYRTQFNESKLHFIQRIMEEAGWFYFFEQPEAGELLVVTDANAGLADIGALPGEGALISGLRTLHGVPRGKEHTADYDPVSPGTEIKGEQATKMKQTGALSPDSFVWPAGTDKPAEAAARSKLRMQAHEAAASLLAGNSEWGKLTPGHIFEVLGSDTFLQPGKYAVRSVTHQAVDESFLAGGAASLYSNSFEVFPESVPWKQQLNTQRPRMDGLHAAVVIGTDAEGDIFTDDLARVKVKFFWDHRGEAAPDQSIWARVVQPWAGKGWGAQFIPRVGTEVAVAFMDGDPDRPVVLGGLYNGVDKPIFTKAEKMKSGFRSRSVDKGGTKDFSEISFDDKKGQEVLFIHAQKDFNIEVENDLNLKVDNCRIVEVKKDETITIKGDQGVRVKGNRTLIVEQGSYKVWVDTDNYETVVKMGNHDLKVKMGNIGVKADLGAIKQEAMQSITFKVGGNSLTIDQTGVTIKGIMVKIEGTAMVDVKAPMTSVKGDGMLILKGGIVLIN
jgi:type VI secretion system secreted protein VgrG